ncbi:hypothetical protein GGR94_002643 [Sulfitobacter geojensis]|nr:hypothetical protein [Sulfitobacter geojensis]
MGGGCTGYSELLQFKQLVRLFSRYASRGFTQL